MIVQKPNILISFNLIIHKISYIVTNISTHTIMIFPSQSFNGVNISAHPLSKFRVRKIVLVTIIWCFIERKAIVKHANVHNILKLSTLHTSYLNCLSDPIILKEATENTKCSSTVTVQYMVWCVAQGWSSDGK